MQNIFFPTDFSDASTRAFVYALHLADKWGASITTYHVYNDSIKESTTRLPINMQRVYDSIELGEFENYRDAIPVLREVAKEQNLEHVEVKHILEKRDRVIPAILERAEAEMADFIVTGTHGASGLKEVFMGSVAGEILENAHCQVLVVPEKAVFDGRIDQIAFTTNYRQEEKTALEHVMAFAAPFQAQIHVVNIDTGHTHFYHQRMNMLQEEYQDQSFMNFHVIEGMSIYEGISHFLKSHKIDCVAMVTHKRNFLEELFNYSKAKKLSYHTHTPILSLPAQTLVSG